MVMEGATTTRPRARPGHALAIDFSIAMRRPGGLEPRIGLWQRPARYPDATDRPIGSCRGFQDLLQEIEIRRREAPLRAKAIVGSRPTRVQHHRGPSTSRTAFPREPDRLQVNEVGEAELSSVPGLAK